MNCKGNRLFIGCASDANETMKKILPDELLSVGDIAKLCNVHRTTVGRWLTKRKIKTIKTFSGYRRIVARDLVMCLEHEGMEIPPELRKDSRHRVVLIDDDNAVRNVLSQALTELDNRYEVRTASDGPAGCLLVGSFQPDLVVLDLMMSGMDGFDVCRSISTLPRDHRPVILVLTGYASSDNIHKALACGADEVLSKPIRLETFCKIIEQMNRTDYTPMQKSFSKKTISEYRDIEIN